MGQARVRKTNEDYPKGAMTSPYGNTSDDAPMTAIFEQLGISQPLFQELANCITDVMAGFDDEPNVVVVEIDCLNGNFDRAGLDPDGIRTLSDGRRVFVMNPDTATDEFILRYTTQDVLTVTQLLARQGKVGLLVFSGKRYALLPIMKVKLDSTLVH